MVRPFEGKPQKEIAAIVALFLSELCPISVFHVRIVKQPQVAGRSATVLFAADPVGTGLLAVPILAGSSAYAMAETFRWREGLYLKLRQAWGFYGIIAFSTMLGAAMDFVHVKRGQVLQSHTAKFDRLRLLINRSRPILHGIAELQT